MTVRPTVFVCLALALNLACAQERISDQIYMKSGGAAFTLDVFKAAKPNAPAVIWLCSGGWFSKHEDINPALAKAFNDQGITCIEVVHGSQPRYQLKDIVPMIRRAVRYVHANAARFGIDPNRIGISGGSAGGHLSLLTAALGDSGDASAKDPVDQASSSVNFVAVFFPPTDFQNWGKANYTPIGEPGMAIFAPAFGVNASSPKDQVDRIAHDMSPMNFVTAKFPPTLIIHGDSDTLVPLQQSETFDAALAKLGVDHKLIVIPGGGHNNKTLEPGMPQLIAWYVSKMKP